MVLLGLPKDETGTSVLVNMDMVTYIKALPDGTGTIYLAGEDYVVLNKDQFAELMKAITYKPQVVPAPSGIVHG